MGRAGSGDGSMGRAASGSVGRVGSGRLPAGESGEAPTPGPAGEAAAADVAAAADGSPPARDTKQGGAAASSWRPSQRVIDMTDDQIAEIRTRLNVTVENGDDGTGSTGLKGAPVESFHDMVRHVFCRWGDTRSRKRRSLLSVYYFPPPGQHCTAAFQAAIKSRATRCEPPLAHSLC